MVCNTSNLQSSQILNQYNPNNKNYSYCRCGCSSGKRKELSPCPSSQYDRSNILWVHSWSVVSWDFQGLIQTQEINIKSVQKNRVTKESNKKLQEIMITVSKSFVVTTERTTPGLVFSVRCTQPLLPKLSLIL